MKLPLFLCVLGVPCVAAVTHSLIFLITGSSQVPNLPEFVGVGFLHEVQLGYYDSNTQIIEPKQEWVWKLTDDDPQYLEGLIGVAKSDQEWLKANIETLKRHSNQTGGLHVVQQIVGCEWDDETGEVNGFNQYGYNGEDFISLDLNTMRWITANQQAVINKKNWRNDEAFMDFMKNFLNQDCLDWGKKCLNLGGSFLLRTELPTVSLLQRTPSSPVTCHATGFYPNRAELIWKKGDEELEEDVVRGQVLPNHDGTFQMSADLDLSRVKAEDWGSYSCVFQLAGVKDDIVTILDKAVIRTNQPGNTGVIAAAVVVGLILLAATAAIGLFMWKRNRSASETSSSSAEDSAVKKTTNEEEVMLKSRG